jgi:hypothetical protein
VTLKRFAAPRCVFNFFFGFEAFLGIDKTFLAIGRVAHPTCGARLPWKTIGIAL